IDDLENLAVLSRVCIGVLYPRPLGGRAIGEGPLEAFDLPGTPGARAIQSYLVSLPGDAVRPRHGENLWFVLAEVGFPEERVAVLDAPPAGGLHALDVEVKVGVTAAATFLAQQSDPLSHL